VRSILFCLVLAGVAGAAGAQAPLSVGPETKQVTLERAQWTCLAKRLERYEASRASTYFIPLVNCQATETKDLEKLSDTVRATGDISLSATGAGATVRGAQGYGGSLRLTQDQFACLVKLRDGAAPPGNGPVKIDFETCKATPAPAAVAPGARP
jgi:hypothetical protein